MQPPIPLPDTIDLSDRCRSLPSPVTIHGPDWVAAVSIRDVHGFDPLSGLEPGMADRVLGGQACLWTEYIDTEEEAQRMLMPRLLAMSEALWSASAERLGRHEPGGGVAANLTQRRSGWCEGPSLQ